MIDRLQKVAILYEDDEIIAVNKPSGLLVHAYKKETNERVHLLSVLKAQTGLYLYPVHRLDRPVSGIVLFGKNSKIVREIKSVWHLDSTVKRYLALVKGILTEPGVFDFPLMNEFKEKQHAMTVYTPLSWFENTTLVSIEIETGRKHQIRRHFSRRCSNVVGDTKYGQGKINRFFKTNFGLSRIFLHACYFKIELPNRGRVIEITCPLPNCLRTVVAALEQKSPIRHPALNDEIRHQQK